MKILEKRHINVYIIENTKYSLNTYIKYLLHQMIKTED